MVFIACTARKRPVGCGRHRVGKRRKLQVWVSTYMVLTSETHSGEFAPACPAYFGRICPALENWWDDRTNRAGRAQSLKRVCRCGAVGKETAAAVADASSRSFPIRTELADWPVPFFISVLSILFN